jgi:hypothetical protein
MELCEDLQLILDEEIRAGNEIAEEYKNAFGTWKVFIALRRPFRRVYKPLPSGICFFSNKDSHYPVGDAYGDESKTQFLQAPFGSFSNDY